MTSVGPASIVQLLERFRAGQRYALARSISIVEDERPGFQELLHAALVGGLRARRVGLTGPPGAGKSSLLAEMARSYRGAGEEVGVVAVDPTSPFSGGALLGDRIRMNDLATDSGIFIRSMATRGSLGGLATTTGEVIDLMDAFGMGHVLIETVGVGQTQFEIAAAADTVVVVLVPESGDAIQAMKAGLMEIGDVFVVNKSDRPGADRLTREIRTALHLRAGDALQDVPAHHGADQAAAGKAKVARGHSREDKRPTEAPAGWEIPVLKTTAQSGEGVPELLNALERHRAHLEASGGLAVRRRVRAERRVHEVVERALRSFVWRSAEAQGRLQAGLNRVAEGKETPYSVGMEILEEVLDARNRSQAQGSHPLP